MFFSIYLKAIILRTYFAFLNWKGKEEGSGARLEKKLITIYLNLVGLGEFHALISYVQQEK